MSTKQKRAILTRPRPYGDGQESFQVAVMAVSGIWAMVRRPGCVPFVVDARTLSELKRP